LKVGRDDKGRHYIIYSFDALQPRSEDALKETVNPTQLTDDQRQAMRHVLHTFEKVANVYFVEAGTKDSHVPEATHCLPEDAHLCFFRDDYRPEITGRAAGMDNPRGGRDIVIFEKEVDIYTFVHELSHAVAGVSHPRNDSDHPGYSKRDTVMSANPGKDIVNFGKFDIAVWQYIFGLSNDPAVGRKRINGEEALHSPVLYREVAVTLDLGSLHTTNHVIVDLGKDTGRHIYSLSEVTSPNGEKGELNIVLAPETRVEKLLPVAEGRMHMKGIAGVQMSGGSNNDVLLAQGGHNTLTGGGSGDSFRFDEKSGRENSITDFSARRGPEDRKNFRNDQIQFLLPDLDHVRMQERKNKSGTDVEAVTEGRQIVTSVFVAGRSPEEIRDHVYKTKVYDWKDGHEWAELEPANLEIVAPSTPAVPSLSRAPQSTGNRKFSQRKLP
jgi:hypothetical protein